MKQQYPAQVPEIAPEDVYMDEFRPTLQHSIIDEDNNIDSLQIKLPAKPETPFLLFPQSSAPLPLPQFFMPMMPISGIQQFRPPSQQTSQFLDPFCNNSLEVKPSQDQQQAQMNMLNQYPMQFNYQM